MENKEILKQEFLKVSPLYQRLSINITESLRFLLKENNISFLDVYSRVKEFDSFFDKIDRKQYKKPFDQIEDICGLRIVCYYPSDILLIKQIIDKEFIIVNSEDKLDSLEPDKFGYRSHHFVVKLRNGWLNVPNYRGLGGCKAEIQVRTILMHAWADISHKLSYKKKEHVPELFQRNLFQLSALFEIADDRFDMLRAERENYRNSMINNGLFNLDQELNLDSLQAFLDFHFPDRVKQTHGTIDLLDELMKYNISLEDLNESYNKVKKLIPKFEMEIFLEDNIERDVNEDEHRWYQSGIIRHILELTNDHYWEDRCEEFKDVPNSQIELIQAQRERVKKNNS
ncbi:GTP pyrophosphokinase [Paenibacillus contaminans]|nr:(p)ppGpp synthetase [Paenibacillus contaminans]